MQKKKPRKGLGRSVGLVTSETCCSAEEDGKNNEENDNRDDYVSPTSELALGVVPACVRGSVIRSVIPPVIKFGGRVNATNDRTPGPANEPENEDKDDDNKDQTKHSF